MVLGDAITHLTESNKRRVCVVTGTRAEYGLLKNLIERLDNSSDFQLRLIVTGSHLSEKFGETYREIEKDGLPISSKIYIDLNDDSADATTHSAAIALKKFGSIFSSLRPELVVVLGDRYEILSVVIAAMFARIPIAHIHGGELTEGAIDESIRHSITKFSHLHFTATDEYRDRVIQLGENPDNVYNVGGMGVDAIKDIKLINKHDVEKSLNLKFKKKNLLITFHPVTLEKDSSSKQMTELLNSLSKLNDTCLIFTMPNADPDNDSIFQLIKKFVSQNRNAFSYGSMGQQMYFSCIPHIDAVVGNSSSGLAEIPSFKKPTINIGDRQRGRIVASSVINCSPLSSEITKAIKKSYSLEFQNKIQDVMNPYGKGGASKRIMEILKKTDITNLIKKEFYDIDQ